MEPYNFIERLGRGAFGTIYLCERKHNKQKVIIKELIIDMQKPQYDVVKNEITILQLMDHPNVIQYYDSYVKDGTFHIVMECAVFGNLHEYISKHAPTYFPREFVMSVFCQILNGLNYIHRKKVIHRDLKCENIFLTGLHEDVVKIGDFGISKVLPGFSTKASTLIGTSNYLAPEMCDGKQYDNKSDIWSLGCILYELCAMERMFEGSVAEVVLSIKSGNIKCINMQRYGTDLQHVISLMLQLDPENRPSTIQLICMPELMAHVQIIGSNIGLI